VKNKFLMAALFFGWLTPICIMAQSNASPQSTANFHHEPGSVISSNDIVVVGSVKQIVSNRTLGAHCGTHLWLNTAQGVVDANLGPYVSDDVRASLARAQLVQVIGIAQTVKGKNSVLARQLVFAGRQVTIRNEYGFLLRPEAPAGVHKGESDSNGGAL